MPTDNIYTGLMAEMRDYLAEVLDDADYPAAVDYLAEIVDDALQEAYRMGWIDAHEGWTV